MPAGAPRPAGAGARILPPLDRPPRRRSLVVRVVAILVGCLVIAGVVVGLLALTGGGSSAAHNSAASNASVTHRPTRPAGFVPSSVSVTVLNGTDISGLAGRVSDQLGKTGYRMGRPTNAANQSTATTLVQYMQPAYRTDALHVASALKLRASSVRLIDASTKAVACQSSTPCTTAVVVTVGSDLATQ